MLTEWGQGCQFNHNNTGECGPVMDLADSRLVSWIDWYWQEQLSPGEPLLYVCCLLLGVAAGATEVQSRGICKPLNKHPNWGPWLSVRIAGYLLVTFS
jgi:hypothetical protein